MAVPFVQPNFDLISTNGNNPWVDGVTYNAYWKNDTNQASPLRLKIYFLKPEDLTPDAPQPPPQSLQNRAKRWDSVFNWPENQRDVYLDSYQAWSAVIPLEIEVVSDINKADIIYARVDFPNHGVVPLGTILGSHQGLANSPNGSEIPLISDINGWFYGEDSDTGRGTSLQETAIHEIGHGIGLGHPHDRGPGTVRSGVFPGLNEGDSFSAYGGLGLYEMNQNVFTIMSYNRGYLGSKENPLRRLEKRTDVGNTATPMALDIMAAQLKYGANTKTNLGDTTYQLPARQEEAFWQCLWDAGGIDLLDASQATNRTSIDLRAAPMNATRPEDGARVERYNWRQKPAWKRVLDFMVNDVTRPGSILGSAYLLGQTLETVLIKADQDGLISKAFGKDADTIAQDLDGFINEYATANNLSRETAVEQLADKLFDAYILSAKALLRDTSTFSDEYYDDLKQQKSILAESASHIGGYISSVRGVQGGVTIAAGVTIEEAIGSPFDDEITGNSAANKLWGLEGKDVIHGGDGDDIIHGGKNKDKLFSDSGHDKAHGGRGGDRFIIDSIRPGSVFEVMDFRRPQGDKLLIRNREDFEIKSIRSGKTIRYYAWSRLSSTQPLNEGQSQSLESSMTLNDLFPQKPGENFGSEANLFAIIHDR